MMLKEEIDQIIEGVVARLQPLLEEIKNANGFIKDVTSVVNTERKQQYKDSTSPAPAFDPTLYE
jgi:hypothetical protein